MNVVACFFIAAHASLALAQQTAVSVQQAVKDGLVDVKVSSLGGATGKTVRVDVRRKVNQNVAVEIQPGTVFLSPTDNVQNMTVGRMQGEFIGPNTYRPTEVNVAVLSDDAWHGYLLESFCMDFHKGPPQRGAEFKLAIQDQRAARILKIAKEQSPSLWAMQFALWMDREGISEDELLRTYGKYGTTVDVQVARKLIKDAEAEGVKTIPEDMPANVRVEVKKLFSPDPAERAAAVNVLVSLGKEAGPAAPFLADNVVTAAPGQADHSTWLQILTNPEQTTVLLEQIGLQDLKALVDAVRERREIRRNEKEERKDEQPDADRSRPLRDRIRKRLDSE